MPHRFLRIFLIASLLLSGWVADAGAQSTREVWHNTRLRGAPGAAPEMVAVTAYPRLPLKRPVWVDVEPGTNRMLVIENLAWDSYVSTLKRFEDRPDADQLETLLEIPGDQEIAYGLCFHPKFSQNGWIYIGSNGKGPGDKHHSRIVRYTLSREAPWRIVEGSRLVIIEWPSNGHNGAAAIFGKDGMLYVTSGDGTPNSDADNAGQNTSSMLAKVMRIDVDGAPPGATYVVPPDNPYTRDANFRPETWAYGLRNPWRITSDPVTGQIWVGQNGQDLREYANLLERGANYGWSAWEGTRPFLVERLKGPAPFTPPTIEHDHSLFRSLTGGFVYRGAKFPALAGAYLYGDYGTGRVWGAKHDGKRMEWNRELADTPAAIAGFGTNMAGDILLADHLGNRIARLEPAPARSPDQRPFPALLSETGLFRSLSDLNPAPGVVPYEVNSPVWHDGATASRWMAIPEGGRATLPAKGDPSWPWRSWSFPDGTVLVQTLTLPADEPAARPASRTETRILLKQDADWAGYSYLWNETRTDAALVEAGGTRLSISGQEWAVPSRTDCVLCHARGANYALGLTVAQLNRETNHEGRKENQITRYLTDGILDSGDHGKDFATGASGWPHLVDPGDASRPLDERVKSYFAGNCAHCHMHEGGGNSRMDLSPWVQGEARHLFDAPQHGAYHMPDARIIAPREPGRSVLPVRVSSRGPGQMPRWERFASIRRV